MKEHYKNCWNCKYNYPQWYSDNLCKSPDLVEIRYDGIVKKDYPKCYDIRPPEFDKPCEFWSPNRRFLIKKFFGGIQMWWYKKRHPEWFI